MVALDGIATIDDVGCRERQCRYEPTKQPSCGRSSEKLRNDEAGCIHRADTCEGVACSTRQRDCRVCKRGRCREPVGRCDVGTDCERYESRSPTGAPPNDGKQTERRDELTDPLC